MASAEDRPERLDLLLVLRGLAPTRAQARALILAGRVRLPNGERVDKPGRRLPPSAPLEVAPGPRYVGRGGHKLARALDSFAVDPGGRDVLDVGASTGGFTQVLLEAGARRVIALDVGRGQLDWELRRDPRVHVLERVNARYLMPEQLPFVPRLATIDVSFISLERVLPPVAACLETGGEIVALAKPQFEAGRHQVGRGGLVKSEAVHLEVLERLVTFCRRQDLGLRDLARSVLPGARGNREFFLHLVPAGAAQGQEQEQEDARIRRSIRSAVKEPDA